MEITFAASSSPGAGFAIFLAALGAGLILVGLLVVLGARHAACEQASIQRVGCGEAVAGRVWRVLGTVRAAQPIAAPLSGVPCAHWRVEVWRDTGSGEDRHYDRVGKLEEAADWWLEDETGRLAVDADGAELKWKCAVKSYGSLLTSKPDAPVYADLLRKMGLDENESCDFYEQYVPLDKPMLAQGRVEQYPKGPYLTGGRDLVLDPKLREDGLGPARGTTAVGVLMAVLGAAVLVGAAFAATSEAQPAAPPARPIPMFHERR